MGRDSGVDNLLPPVRWGQIRGIWVALPLVINRGIKLPSFSMQPPSMMWTNCVNGSCVEFVS